MTTPPATHPASHCPDAAHTLQWGLLHPDSTTQGWILARQHDDGSSVVAALDGYPHGRPPVPAGEAREWADRILGAAQEWVEQPAGSGAYHRHDTVAASPGAALNSTPDPQPDRSHRTVLAVTVTSRLDGGHYINQADFTAHVAQWLKTDLKGHHAIAEVTVDDQAAELSRAQAEAHQYRTALQGVARKAAAPVAAPPTGQAGLRDQIVQVIADALKPRYGGPQHNTPGGLPLTATAEELRLHRAQPLADAVLPVLPADSEPHRLALSTALGLGTGAPWDAIRERAAELAGQAVAVDRAAVLREAAGLAEDVAIKRHGQHEIEREQGALDVMTKLRRLAAEAQPCSGYETQPNRCACPCEGCRHNCAAHQAAETPGPETQGAQFPCQCGHGEAYHDFKYGGPRCRLCPESGEWTWRHAFRSAVMSQPEQVEAPSEPVHARPGPDDNGISPCCARPPFEFRGERLTRDPAKVTCIAPTVTLPGKEA